MQLIISDKIADKIWTKDQRHISTEDVQAAWQEFEKSEWKETVLDDRTEHDSWPPTEWILVHYKRKTMKLVFIIHDDERAVLKTAYYVDKRTVRVYEDLGGVIYG